MMFDPNLTTDHCIVSGVTVSWEGFAITDTRILIPEQVESRKWRLTGPPGYYRRVWYEIEVPMYGSFSRFVQPQIKDRWMAAGDSLIITFRTQIDLEPWARGVLVGEIEIDIKEKA